MLESPIDACLYGQAEKVTQKLYSYAQAHIVQKQIAELERI
jgi:hypothetical protein